MDRFEDQLWTELTQAHGDELAGATRPPARRGRGRPIALTAGALGVAGVATAVSLALTATGSAPAYAVTKHADGTVTIAIHDLGGVAGANAALAKLGVPVRAVAVDPACQRKLYLVPNGSRLDFARLRSGADEVAVRPAQIPSGDVLVVTAQRSGSGVAVFTVVAANAPLPSCVGTAPGH